MATVLLPRSLLALFPGVDRRHDVGGDSVRDLIDTLDLTVPGLRDRLVDVGPRLRPHINVFVDGQPAELATPVAPHAVVHVIPAVSGGAGRQRPGAEAALAARPQDRLERIE